MKDDNKVMYYIPSQLKVVITKKTSLQENILLVINFSDQKLLVTIITNLNANLKNKKLLVTKIVTIINKKYNYSLN